MNKSESIAKVSAAFTKAWGSIETPKHNKKVSVRMKSGGSYQFEYTDLSGIVDTIRESLKENELAFMQDASITQDENGKQHVSVTTKIIHSSGEFLESSPMKLLASGTIQDIGGMVTYLKRYSLSAMMGISTEEDDDANGSIGNQATKQQYKQPAKQSAPKPKTSSLAQQSEIERKAKEYIKIQGTGTISALMEFLKISDIKLISENHAKVSIKKLDEIIAAAKKKQETDTLKELQE